MIVLDTHIWLWYVNKNWDKIPDSWLSEIEETERVGITTISCYEVVLANKKGRLELPSDVPVWFDKATNATGIELIPMTTDITYRAVNLSPIHKDPFDRLIIATALAYKAKLASVDRLFSEYSELADHLMKIEETE